MIKRKLIRKLVVTSTALFALLLIYLVPGTKEKMLPTDQSLTYTDKTVKTSSIYLMDNENYLAKAVVNINSDDNIENKIKELLEILIIGGTGENRIPNGFKSLIPSETKVLNVKFENSIAKINFSKDLLDVNMEMEEKVIESIIYTITTIPDVKGIIIYIEDEILTQLPKSKTQLPSTLDRNFGINKNFDLSSTNSINQVTIYYVNKYNDNSYYVPVTKYLNDNRDKIKIIIDELASNPVYNPNLMSFLNSNTELLTVNEENDTLKLSFNSYILNNLTNKDILEEVIYTISLSVKDNYDVNEVIFNFEDEEIYKSVLKTIE